MFRTSLFAAAALALTALLDTTDASACMRPIPPGRTASYVEMEPITITAEPKPFPRLVVPIRTGVAIRPVRGLHLVVRDLRELPIKQRFAR